MSAATANQRPHGHVTPNADGSRTRCGGPTICKVCMQELAALKQPISDEREAFEATNPMCETLKPYVEWSEDQCKYVITSFQDFEIAAERRNDDWQLWQKARARLGNAVVMPAIPALTEAELENLKGFHLAVCCDQGHTLSKCALDRLEEIGALKNEGKGKHRLTEFGVYLLSAATTPAPTVEPAHSDDVIVPLELLLEAIAVLMLYTRGSASREGVLINDLRALLNGGRS